MFKLARKNSETTVEKDDVNTLIIDVSLGDFEQVKKIVCSVGLCSCECLYGGYTPLLLALKLGHVEIAKFLLEQGAKVNSRRSQTSTPIHLACEQGYADIVQMLLEKKVRVDVRDDKDETPFHLAAKNGHVNVVEMILKANVRVMSKRNNDFTPLYLAAEGRHAEVVEMLLEHTRANVETSVFQHILQCDPDLCDKFNELVVRIVLDDYAPSKTIDHLIDHGFVLRRGHVNKPFLSAAVKKNCIKLIDSILKSGGNPNDAERDPELLYFAVVGRRKEIVDVFLKAGFDPNFKIKNGKTYLYYSLDHPFHKIIFMTNIQEKKCAAIIQSLLASGADIGEAPDLLHRAVDSGLFDVCRVLIRNNADIFAMNERGKTPLDIVVDCNFVIMESENAETIRSNIIKLILNSCACITIGRPVYKSFHHAISFGTAEVVSIFLEFGVDVDCGTDGHRPLCEASSMGRSEILELLCKCCAEVNSSTGQSPLYEAARRSRIPAVKMLLKFGAIIDFDLNEVKHGDDDIECNEDCSCALALLKKHLIKLKAVGLDVAERYDSHLNEPSFASFESKCEEEVLRMKIPIIDSQPTLFDVVVNGQEPSFARNQLLTEFLKSFNYDTCPIYKNLIMGNMEISQSKLDLLRSGQQTLSSFVKLALPSELLEKIISYLSFSEVKNLVSCGKALKRELSKQYFPLER